MSTAPRTPTPAETKGEGIMSDGTCIHENSCDVMDVLERILEKLTQIHTSMCTPKVIVTRAPSGDEGEGGDDDGTLPEDFDSEDQVSRHCIPRTDPSHPDYVPPDKKAPKPRRKIDRQERIGKEIGKKIRLMGLDYRKKYSTFGKRVYRTKFHNIEVIGKRHRIAYICKRARAVCKYLRTLNYPEVDFITYQIKDCGIYKTVSIYVFYKKPGYRR